MIPLFLVFGSVMYEWPDQPEVQGEYSVTGFLEVDRFGISPEIQNWDIYVGGESPAHFSSDTGYYIIEGLIGCGLEATPDALYFARGKCPGPNIFSFVSDDNSRLTKLTAEDGRHHYISEFPSINPVYSRWEGYFLEGDIILGINPTIFLELIQNKSPVDVGVAVVPEPGAIFLLSLGVALALLVKRGKI